MRTTVYKTSLTLALISGLLLCQMPVYTFAAEERASTSQHASLVMTNDEFQQWYQSKAAVDRGSQGDGIQLISASGVAEATQTLKGHVESFDYVLGAGDTISVLVHGKADLSRQQIILTNLGVITLPLIGDYVIDNKSFQTITKELTERYKEYLVDPQVQVVLDKPRPQITYILGAVQSPGPYTQTANGGNLPENIKKLGIGGNTDYDYSLSTALGNAGGIREDADLEHIKVYNERQGYLKEVNLYDLLVYGKTDLDIKLKPNDVVYIPKLQNPAEMDLSLFRLIASTKMGKHKFSVPVYGLVNSPGLQEVDIENLTLQKVLAKAGGVVREANPHKIVIARVLPDGRLDKFMVDSAKVDFQLKPNDMVLVSDTRTAYKILEGTKYIAAFLAPAWLTNNIWRFGTR